MRIFPDLAICEQCDAVYRRPALDARGNLVGLNFDRVWEGTMSDINYDPAICRNIMVDIRYVLFIMDKYAGAGHLVEEMKLVSSKK